MAECKNIEPREGIGLLADLKFDDSKQILIGFENGRRFNCLLRPLKQLGKFSIGGVLTVHSILIHERSENITINFVMEALSNP